MNETPGPYEAIVLADSVTQDAVRLTTLCCTFPRIVLAEFNTHRVFSRNSASSRAIPVAKRIEQIRGNPYVPLQFGTNRRGMQAGANIEDQDTARVVWFRAMNHALTQAHELAEIGVHKQWANRILEPFAWHTVIVSATEWANFWALRISEHAQPEILKVAEAMKAAMDASSPASVGVGDWHLPLVSDEERSKHSTEVLVKLSVARTAAVSYERHMEQNVERELARYEMLKSNGHMSPFEHAAMVGTGTAVLQLGAFDSSYNAWVGNFRAPWIQHRKQLPGEAVFGS